jgi:hypothetical protein
MSKAKKSTFKDSACKKAKPTGECKEVKPTGSSKKVKSFGGCKKAKSTGRAKSKRKTRWSRGGLSRKKKRPASKSSTKPSTGPDNAVVGQSVSSTSVNSVEIKKQEESTEKSKESPPKTSPDSIFKVPNPLKKFKVSNSSLQVQSTLELPSDYMRSDGLSEFEVGKKISLIPLP